MPMVNLWVALKSRQTAISARKHNEQTAEDDFDKVRSRETFLSVPIGK